MAYTIRSLALGERLILATLLAGLTALTLQQDWLWRWDQLIYDGQLRFWSRPASSEVVIVAIDEQSLSQLGRWPWQRVVHAQLLDRLLSESPRVVVFDIIFAESDHSNPQGDLRFAEAMASNGRVVLPVLMEPDRHRGAPAETLPLPIFAEQAADLGHVHVELDRDGIARRLYLYAGLGSSRWPHISLAALNVAGLLPAGTQTRPQEAEGAPAVWYRRQPRLIPFAGPPGHFQRISYSQVLQGEYLPGTFRDKLILIGTTTAGLGDALPTPVSGFSHSMPGVEINANMLDSLMRGHQIIELPTQAIYAISLILAVLPLFLYPYLAPRMNLVAAGVLFFATLVLTGALLFSFQRWFPPAAALLAIALSYPLWSWRRLERAMGFLNQELDELHKRQAELAIHRELQPQPALDFLEHILPIQGWTLLDDQGGVKVNHRGVTAPPRTLPENACWRPDQQIWYCPLPEATGYSFLLLYWFDDRGPDREEKALLSELSTHLSLQLKPASNPSDVLQARITQVQMATRQLQAFGRFVDDAMSNMADGVVVTDAFGQILLANTRAHQYLTGKQGQSLTGQPLTLILEELPLQDGGAWQLLIREALLKSRQVQTNVRRQDGRDLLVQIAPLVMPSEYPAGLVFNFSDISQLKASERKRNEMLNFLSHDLRSPLVSLTALIELAEAKQPQEAVSKLLARMRGHTEKTIDLAEQFLQLVRAESSEQLNFQDLDLTTVVWNALEEVWAQAKTKHIRLEKRFLVEDAWVFGDGSLLERTVVNLLTNAIKYSPENTAIEITLRQQGEQHFRLCVIDQGYGIPAAAIPHLFDRFSRVERSSQQQVRGAGLGLAFVDAVVRRHGGDVDVLSEEGKGSRFCILLRQMQLDAKE